MDKLENYMFYENKISDLLNIKNNFKKIIIEDNPIPIVNENTQIDKNDKYCQTKYSTPKIFYPNYDDTLFWCFYIILKGEFNYETMKKNALVSKQLKIEFIKKIRDNKLILKKYKFDTLSNIESNLVNDNNINVKSLLTLCLIENINIIFVRNNTYTELINETNNKIYIIYEKQNNKYNNNQYGYEISTEKLLNDIRSTKYKIELTDINKPIKSISAYKVIDLITICKKLAIDIINKDTKKTNTKNILYKEILQTLNI
jgi:hypothetical protein